MTKQDKQFSPLPTKPEIFDFYKALKEMRNGKTITRVAWPEGEYGKFDETVVKVFRNGQFHNWVINDGDVDATDWKIV